MRYPATSALLALTGLSNTCLAMVYDFKELQPSAKLNWQPCYDGFTCTRLQVPLDHGNKALGNTSIAFIKLAGQNATKDSPSVVILPGGPGNSGIDLLLGDAAQASVLLGPQYNIVSFDPRGVNNSGLVLDCFSGNSAARDAWHRVHNTGITNLSSVSLQDQYYSSSIYGEWCNHAVETETPHGYYVTTPATAEDILTFVEAEASLIGRDPAKAKLWTYGVSYGSVIGATFASMFPDRVERMILDGIVDADLYYRNEYTANLDDQDEAMHQFSKLCHSAGPEKCSFWGPSVKNITDRLDCIIRDLLEKPVPVNGASTGGTPTMVTYSDLKGLFLNTIYTPIATFPGMADILHEVENGNVTGLIGMFASTIIPGDANHVIQCADAYRYNGLKSIEQWKYYVELANRKSKYLGDMYPIFVDTLTCRAMKPSLPDSMVVKRPNIGTDKPTSFPIVFASNTIDPITPLISAKKSSARFPGSVILLQEGVGHTVINQGGSQCYAEKVQAYYSGIVPKSYTKCAAEFIPFINSPF